MTVVFTHLFGIVVVIFHDSMVVVTGVFHSSLLTMMLLVHLFLSSTTVLIHSSVLVSVVVIHQLSRTVSHPHTVVVTGLLPCSLFRKIFIFPVSLSFTSVTVHSSVLVSVVVIFHDWTTVFHDSMVVVTGVFHGS